MMSEAHICRRCNHPKGKGDTVATRHCNVVTKKNKPCACPTFVGPVQQPKRAQARGEKIATMIELRNAIQEMTPKDRLLFYMHIGLQETSPDIMKLLNKATEEFMANLRKQLGEWKPKETK